VGQFPVPCLVYAPAASDFLIVQHAPGIVGGTLFALSFELVDLAARAGLMPIHATGLQEPGTTDLLTLGIKHDRCDEAVG